MPVDYRRYPSNWKTEIRPRILERARNRCEWCGVENGAIGHRDATGGFSACRTLELGNEDRACEHRDLAPIRIVLTIAHLNHEPMDCRDENLRALCQKCHLTYDAKLHARNAAETRRKRRIALGQGVMLS